MISQMTVRGLRLAACLVVATAALGAQARPAATPAQRAQWLEMFARGYYPGRSGQIFVVAREGQFVIYHDPLYGFMHGSPWEYDTHIPLVLYGKPFVKQGKWKEPARQQDVAPTLGALIGATPSASMNGRVLKPALAATADRPRLVVLVVLDSMRADYLTRYAAIMPTLTRMRDQGSWFTETRINYLPTVTSVGHATIGTGTDPRFHGEASNEVFNTITGKRQLAYDGLDPRELMTPTLADMWNIQTGGRAVIVGQGGAIRATAGLVGHGACLLNGHKMIAASYNATDGGWETNPQCFTMSEALKPLNARTAWEAVGGTWMGHDVANASRFRHSALFQRFEAEALLAVLEREPLGADEIADLVFVNMKGPDYVSHAYGPDSAEMKDELAELDRQLAKLLELIERKAGAGHSVIAITADHGQPGDPGPTGRHFFDDVVASLNARFDPDGKSIVNYYGDPANAQLYMNEERLRTLNVPMKAVADFLASLDFYAAAFTEDEVRAAAARLPR
jgi:Type I phosphodiesterase / nucleotide pyrophosphatase